MQQWSKPTSSTTLISEVTPAEETLALVKEAGSTLQLDGTFVQVEETCGSRCELKAIMNTGSPVSFVKLNVYNKHIELFVKKLNKTNRFFVNVRGSPLNVVGVVPVELPLNVLKGKKITVNLYVIKESSFDSDIILDREFIRIHKFTLIYKLHDTENEGQNAHVDLMANLPLLVEDSDPNSISEIMKETQIDYNMETKKELIETIEEVNKEIVKPIDDGYAVKVYLKDDSTFAYAPRRFAHVERLQLREITDDLLKRSIIKTSILPYCSRVVPVKKKNDKLDCALTYDH